MPKALPNVGSALAISRSRRATAKCPTSDAPCADPESATRAEGAETPRPAIRSAALVWRMLAFLKPVRMNTLLDAHTDLRDDVALFALLHVVHRLCDEGHRRDEIGMWLPIDERGYAVGEFDEHFVNVVSYLAAREVRPQQLTQSEVQQLFVRASGSAPNVWIPCQYGSALIRWLRLVLGASGRACCTSVSVQRDGERATVLRLWFGRTVDIDVRARVGHCGPLRSESDIRWCILHMEAVAAALDADHVDCLRWFYAAGKPLMTRPLKFQCNCLPPERDDVPYHLSTRLADWKEREDALMNKNSHSWSHLLSFAQLAVALGRTASLEFFLSHNVVLDPEDKPVYLLRAVLAGADVSFQRRGAPSNAGCIAILAAAGFDVSSNATDALQMAVGRRDRTDCVEALLDFGADPDAVVNGSNACGIAAHYGRLEALRLLHRRGAKLEVAAHNRLSALFDAIDAGRPKVVSFILENAAPGTWDIDSEATALISDDDTISEKVELLEALVKGGAKVLSLPIPRIAFEDLPLLCRLLEAGLHPDAADSNGCGALHAVMVTCQRDKVALTLLKILVGAGANVNLRDGAGNTVAHYAAQYGRLQCLSFLHAAKADFSIVNTNGETVLRTAARNHQDECHCFIADMAAASHLTKKMKRVLRP